MTQRYHERPQYWPLPVGTGVLIEIDFAKPEVDVVVLLDGGFRNLATGRVRATSPSLDPEVRHRLLPEGDGTFGQRIVFAESTLRYLEESEYQACGFAVPAPETNGLGDLAYINFERIIAVMDEPTPEGLPFLPLGGRVFFEYDLDDDSDNLVTTDGGVLVREKDLATGNQLATVIGVGPKAEFLRVGDRIIARRSSSSINFEGRRYYFVSNEHEVVAVLRPAHDSIPSA